VKYVRYNDIKTGMVMEYGKRGWFWMNENEIEMDG
jgi:hypothetical protein